MTEAEAVMEPTSGRIVWYRLSSYDVEKIRARRLKSKGLFEGLGPIIGELVPMDVVKVSTHDKQRLVSGQAKLNGNDTLWVTAATEGTLDGQWQWPPRHA